MKALKAIVIADFIIKKSSGSGEKIIMKIYLAGDSIVQDYTDEEFIAGWGQYLPEFFNSSVKVINHAKGGRSTRLFINEGRYDRLMSEISEGDYLLIEFCHNDDASKPYKTMFNRLVELGEPDESGRYPIIPGELMPKDYLPKEYISALYEDDAITNKQAVIDSVYKMFQEYPGDMYYPYSPNAEKGSYKWFLKQFVDGARQNGAVPVFVTAPARCVFDENGKIKDGAALHGGNNFCYIRAMKQLAEESAVPVLDLFEYSVRLFEEIGPEKIHYITSIKQGINKGVWPSDFEEELKKPETVSEDTHFNKYGAFLITKGLAQLIRKCNNKQLEKLKGLLIDDFDKITKPCPSELKNLHIEMEEK